MRQSYPAYVCPGCGVAVYSQLGLAEAPGGQEVCLFCAPYDSDREDFAVLFLHDAHEDLDRQDLRKSPQMGSKDEIWQKPPRLMLEAARAETALKLNDFLKGLLAVLYEDAPRGSPLERVRTQSQAAIEDVSRFIRAKLEADPARTGPIIVAGDTFDRYYAVLDLLQNRYVIAHKKWVESQPDREQARFRSYGHFWNLGALIRRGTLADRPAPWVTGQERPRF